MGWRAAWVKKCVLAVAAIATSFAVTAFGASLASAANLDHSQSITFTSSDGVITNCTLLWAQDYDATNRQLTVYLYVEEVTAADTACVRGPFGDTTRIDTSYAQASDGKRVTTTAYGTGGVGAVYNGVKNAQMFSEYFVTLYDCNVNVSSCSYSFTLSQPK
jgi:hypothetical protein